MIAFPLPGAIRNLIFDLGGVLLRIDYERPIAAFRALSPTATPLAFNQQAQAPLFDALEIGALSDADFRTGLRAAYRIPDSVPDAALDAAWNSILIDLPRPRVALLRALRAAGYRLFLLSNTNALHRKAFDALIRADHPELPNALADLFDRVYYSHELGLRKPDPLAFQRVVTDNDLRPAETLFIDDSPQHVAAARAVGLRACWLGPGLDLTDPLTSPLPDALASPR